MAGGGKRGDARRAAATKTTWRKRRRTEDWTEAPAVRHPPAADEGQAEGQAEGRPAGQGQTTPSDRGHCSLPPEQGEGATAEPVSSAADDTGRVDAGRAPEPQGTEGRLFRLGPAFGDPTADTGSQGEEGPGLSLGVGESNTGRGRGWGRGLDGGRGRDGGRGQGQSQSSAKGGRPPTGEATQGGPRWCKPLFVADPSKANALLRASARTGKEEDKTKILCRMCAQAISFSASSYTTAAKHVGTHGVTRDSLEVAVAFANRAEEDGKPFPFQEWKDHLQAGAGLRKVASYMRQAPYDVGSQRWNETRAAMARWIAADSLPLNLVESPSFRRFCTTLNGRCPGFSRKAISNKVRSSPNRAVWQCLMLVNAAIVYL